MNANDIAFPNLGIYLENVKSGFTIGGFYIAFYGMIIGLGLLLGFILALRIAKAEGYDQEIIWDFVIYAIVFSIIGARLYYVAFSWEYYSRNPLQIINTRGGGMAIYGAVIGAFITLLVYCKVKKLSFLQLGDICAPGLPLGQLIGRWGNFFNREAFGEYSDGLFAMRLPLEKVRGSEISESIAAHIVEGTNYIQVHPTFLYEAAWNTVLLIFMLLYRKHQKFKGEIILIYLGGYGLGRYFIEGLRTDQLQIGQSGIAVSQQLGLILFIVSVIIIIVVNVKTKMHRQKELNNEEQK